MPRARLERAQGTLLGLVLVKNGKVLVLGCFSEYLEPSNQQVLVDFLLPLSFLRGFPNFPKVRYAVQKAN